MPTIRGQRFRLALVDTNVLSEIIKDEPLRRSFFGHLNSARTLPAMSIWSVVEIRRRQDLWQGFLELFSVAPFVLFKPPKGTFDAERASYPETDPGAPIQHVFSPADPDPKARTAAFFEDLFRRQQVLDAEIAWPERWKQEVIDSIEGLKPNFPPRVERYDAHDGERFVELGVTQWVNQHAPRWSRRIAKRGTPVASSGFPSVAMHFWTVFFRFYAEARAPEAQDVFDIMIAGPAPYVEATFTEGFQAEIFRKVQRRGHLLTGLEEIKTLRDLR